MEHRTFHIHGQVQGVFYRQSSQQKARSLGITGFARNNPDGTVTIEAEGPAAALQQLEKWCRHGPPAARVERVEVAEGEVKGYADFAVQRT